MREKIDHDAIRREQAQLLRSIGMSLQKAANITGLTKNIVYKLEKKIEVGSADETLDIRMNNGEACVCRNDTGNRSRMTRI